MEWVVHPARQISTLSAGLNQNEFGTLVHSSRNYSEQDKRWIIGFNPDGKTREAEPAADVQLRSVIMVCDTLEEVDSLMLLSAQAREGFKEYLKSTTVNLNAMITKIKPERLLLQREDEWCLSILS